MYHNLRKAWRRWWMISKVLTNTRAMVWDRGIIYKVVAQAVLLYGINSWVVMTEMLKVLEGFHHWSARRIAGITGQRTEDGDKEYPPVADVL